MSAGSSRSARPEDIYNRPKTRFVADFVGSANLIAGRVAAARGRARGRSRFDAAGGLALAGVGGACAARRRDPCRDPHRLYRHGRRAAERRRPTPRPGTIRQRLFHGDFIQYIVDWPAGATDRAPAADRIVRRRRRGHPVLCARALHFAGRVSRRRQSAVPASPGSCGWDDLACSGWRLKRVRERQMKALLELTALAR